MHLVCYLYPYYSHLCTLLPCHPYLLLFAFYYPAHMHKG